MGPVDEAVRVCRAADAMEAVYKPHCMQCFGEITLPGGSIFACGCFTCDKCLPSPRSCPEHGAASAHLSAPPPQVEGVLSCGFRCELAGQALLGRLSLRAPLAARCSRFRRSSTSSRHTSRACSRKRAARSSSATARSRSSAAMSNSCSVRWGARELRAPLLEMRATRAGAPLPDEGQYARGAHQRFGGRIRRLRARRRPSTPGSEPRRGCAACSP